MGREHEEAQAQESARRGAWTVWWAGVQRGQKARQQAEWSQGRSGQKPQKDVGREAQCSTSTAWTAEESLTAVIATICARFGRKAIGFGKGGIRYSAPVRH